MSDIEPCPSCGEQAHLVVAHNIFLREKPYRGHIGYRVECYQRCLMTCWWHEDEKHKAIEIWNKRLSGSINPNN